MKGSWLCCTVALAALLLPCWLHAQTAAPEDLFCRNGGFPGMEKDVSLAQVVGMGRLHLLGDMDGCPRDDESCRQGHGYVLPGDVLLAGRTHGGYRCVFYPDRSGGSAGWVRQDRLRLLPLDATPSWSAWVGHWRDGGDGDNAITISRKGDALTANGEAYWPANLTEDEWPGGPNLGAMEGTAKPVGRQVIFTDHDDDGCTVKATLVDKWLVVSDNHQCGGMNVNFDGVYGKH